MYFVAEDGFNRGVEDITPINDSLAVGHIHPNPVDDEVQLVVTSDIYQEVTISIVDESGRKVYEATEKMIEGDDLAHV